VTRSLRVTVRCPHAKPDDPCMLPPGVRYCVCYGDQHREPVGQLAVVGGQIVWSAQVQGRARGHTSYVAVLRQGVTLAPVELQDEANVRETVEGGRAFYVLRGPREQRVEVLASALVEAALEGREYVDAAPVTVH
jgi:hypothetical protein